MANIHGSFGARADFSVGGETYEIFRLDAVEGGDRLPYSLKILLENLLRNEDGVSVRDDDIRALVALGAQVNVLLLPGMTVEHLAGLGVARISTGSLLFRVALSAAVRVASDVAAGAPAPTAALSYAEANALSR